MSARPGFRLADDGGQMLILVMALLLVLTGLCAHVMNLANRAQRRAAAQEAADRAAYTSTATRARGLNYLSHANIAILQLTAELAVIDAIQPTVDSGNRNLDGWQVVANILKGFWLTAPLGVALEIVIRVERIALVGLGVAGRALRAVAPLLTAARRALSVAQGYVVADLTLSPAVEGEAAARDILPDAFVADAMVRPQDVLPRPLSLPLPAALRSRPAQHYRARGDAELNDVMGRPASRLDWLFLSRAGSIFRSNARSAFDRRMRGDGVNVWTLQSEGGAVSQEFADRHFRPTWIVRTDPPRSFLRSLFGGERANEPMNAVAEALAFNSSRWDLVTPQWRAALVPVKRTYLNLARPLDALHPIHH